MNAIRKLYKPVLPTQMRHLRQSTHRFQLVDFTGQKTSYFFTSQNYARHLASRYANELDALCYVLVFQFAPFFYQHITFERVIDDDCCVFGIPIEKLDMCFPDVRMQTQVVEVCAPSAEGHPVQCQLFSTDNNKTSLGH